MTTGDEKETELTAQNRAPGGWFSIPVRTSLCRRKPIHELLKKVQMAECTSIPTSWTESIVSSSFVLVFYCCHDKLPQMQGLQTIPIHNLPVYRSGV